MTAACKADWVAADWGTSYLRAWAMAHDGSVLATAKSKDGMGRLCRSDFEPALLALIENWLPLGKLPVVICGMAGARQGWAEAPYRLVPCSALGGRPVQAPTEDPRLDVCLVPGIKQVNPADVARGEETQIAGYLAQNPGFDGVLCLPGTHCKWAQISAGEIVRFRTVMTGELFALLSKESVLHHTVAAQGWNEGAFLESVFEAMAKPEALAARLFSLRAEDLLFGLDKETARTRLSGLLIGAELAATRAYWLGHEVAVIGDEKLVSIYSVALGAQGVTQHTAEGPAMTVAGLVAVHNARCAAI